MKRIGYWGAKLKKIKEKENITFAEMANLIGYSCVIPTVAHWCNGTNSTPCVKYQMRIRKVWPKYFLKGETQ